MQFVIKLFVAVIIIILAQYIAQSRPSLAGLIAVMPLTGLIVMLWVWHNSGGDAAKMDQYTLGAVWGIIPAILFFAVAYFCFRARLHLYAVLVLSTATWVIAALIHQYFLHHG
jgi:uncharacterized membrane protein (GlpM family)